MLGLQGGRSRLAYGSRQGANATSKVAEVVKVLPFVPVRRITPVNQYRQCTPLL